MTTVLIVDDDDHVRKLYQVILVKRGFRVVEAGNGKDATGVVESRPVDLVITDIFMPEKDGLEVIAYLRAMWPEIKIIAVSGGFSHSRGGIHVDSGFYLHMAGVMGADITLYKPVASHVLNKAIDDIFDAEIVAYGPLSSP